MSLDVLPTIRVITTGNRWLWDKEVSPSCALKADLSTIIQYQSIRLASSVVHWHKDAYMHMQHSAEEYKARRHEVPAQTMNNQRAAIRQQTEGKLHDCRRDKRKQRQADWEARRRREIWWTEKLRGETGTQTEEQTGGQTKTDGHTRQGKGKHVHTHKHAVTIELYPLTFQALFHSHEGGISTNNARNPACLRRKALPKYMLKLIMLFQGRTSVWNQELHPARSTLILSSTWKSTSCLVLRKQWQPFAV